jgi:hypothetical protein
MSIDEGMSTLSSEYHVLSEPGASSHTNCDWGFDFDAFDAFYGEDAPETLDIAMETGTEAAPLNPGVGVSSLALTPDTPTERQSTHGRDTGEETTQLQEPEPIDTGHSPVSVTRSVVGTDFANDMATGDKALDLTRDAPTQMSSGIDPQRSVAFDWNLSGIDPAFSVFPNHDPDLGDSLALPPAGPIASTTMGMQLPSQTSNGVGSAQSPPPNLPDDICQLIAKECLKQHGYACPNTLSTNLARGLAQNYLNKHGYHWQPPATYSQRSSNATHQQTTQFSRNLDGPTFGFLDPAQLASSPLPASFPQGFGTDVDFTAGVFPGSYNIDIAQTPSKLGFGGSHFPHEDMVIPQTSFDGALFSVTHNTDAMNNELYFDPAARQSTELPCPANSGQSPALAEFRTGAEPIEEHRGPLNQAQQDLAVDSRPDASSTSSANSERQAGLPALQRGNSPRSKRKNSSPHSGRSKGKPNEATTRRACLNCKLKNLKVSTIKPYSCHC